MLAFPGNFLSFENLTQLICFQIPKLNMLIHLTRFLGAYLIRTIKKRVKLERITLIFQTLRSGVARLALQKEILLARFLSRSR